MFHVSRISLAFLPCCPSSHEMTHFSGAHFLARLASSAASASSTLPSLLTSRTSEPFGFLEKKVRVISFRPINRDERCEKKGGRRQRSCVFWIFSASSRREVWCGLKFTSGDRGTRRKHARGRRGGLGVQDYWSYLLQSAGNSTGDSRRSFLGGLCHCVHSTRDRVLHGTRNASATPPAASVISLVPRATSSDTAPAVSFASSFARAALFLPAMFRGRSGQCVRVWCCAVRNKATTLPRD